MTSAVKIHCPKAHLDS